MNTQNNLNAIMSDICNGLTDDLQANAHYLKQQLSRYEHHTLRTEIFQGIQELIRQMIPKDQKALFQNYLRHYPDSIKESLRTIEHAMAQDNDAFALEQLEDLILKVEKSDPFKDTTEIAVHSFNETFEAVLYQYYFKPQKNLCPAAIPYSKIYALHGTLLLKKERPFEARMAFKKGLHWNPVSFKLLFGYAKSFQSADDLGTCYHLIHNALKVAFKASDVATCFTALSDCYQHQGQFSAASACQQISHQYSNFSHRPDPIIPFSSKETPFSQTALKAIAKASGFPLGADPEVLQIARHYSKVFLQENDLDHAGYFLSIVLQLSDPSARSSSSDNSSFTLSGKKCYCC